VPQLTARINSLLVHSSDTRPLSNLASIIKSQQVRLIKKSHN